MSYQQIDDLPAEVREKLPNEAQQIFLAAYNAASDDGMDEKNATQVAWNSVRNNYEESTDGSWQHKDKTGGNRENPTGTMRGG
ncbi:hypothetical protein STA3757_02490 [Stanieria sp. NIES-3757]|nr:hypothetical protein STA3757_02490 [Stanieria sp. NIES-3757]